MFQTNSPFGSDQSFLENVSTTRTQRVSQRVARRKSPEREPKEMVARRMYTGAWSHFFSQFEPAKKTLSDRSLGQLD